MKCDLPDVLPDPSLGELPRARAPATHPRGASRPPGPTDPGPHPARVRMRAKGRDGTGRRSRHDRDVPDEARPPRTSCPGCTGFGGDRVHRGEPLLLGVDKEYQITYRLFARAP